MRGGNINHHPSSRNGSPSILRTQHQFIINTRSGLELYNKLWTFSLWHVLVFRGPPCYWKPRYKVAGVLLDVLSWGRRLRKRSTEMSLHAQQSGAQYVGGWLHTVWPKAGQSWRINLSIPSNYSVAEYVIRLKLKDDGRMTIMTAGFVM